MLILIIKLLICIVLFHSALHKIQTPKYVIEAFGQYQLIRLNISPKQTQSFGIFELFLIILWQIPNFNNEISALIFLLFTGYTCLLLSAYFRGMHNITCGCSGPAVHLKIGLHVILRNFGYLLMIACAALKWEALTLSNMLIALPASVCLFFLLISYEQLLSNHDLIQRIEKFS